MESRSWETVAVLSLMNQRPKKSMRPCEQWQAEQKWGERWFNIKFAEGREQITHVVHCKDEGGRCIKHWQWGCNSDSFSWSVNLKQN